MSTNSKVSFRALRVLTYTVLFKAIIDALIPVSRITDRHGLSMVAQAMEFVCIVACVMCLGGVTALSGKFVSVRRIMVVVLILDCITLLMIIFELQMIIGDYTEAAAGFESLALVSHTAERLLIGAAFLLFMKGFGEALRKVDDSIAAEASERLGSMYLCFSCAGAIVAAFAVSTGRASMTAASAVFELAEIILELLMYRSVSGAALLLWRKRAAVTDERTRLL